MELYLLEVAANGSGAVDGIVSILHDHVDATILNLNEDILLA